MDVKTLLSLLAWQDACWVSAPVPVPLFGGVEVRLQIFPESKGEERAVLAADQIEALERFFSLPPSRASEIVPHLWRYYQDMWVSVGPPVVPEIPDPQAIWKHIQPSYLSLDRDEHGTCYVVIESECDWEIEHGLLLVLQNGDRWARVSDCSGHLTDGVAWGQEFLDDWMADPSKTLPVRGIQEFSESRR